MALVSSFAYGMGCHAQPYVIFVYLQVKPDGEVARKGWQTRIAAGAMLVTKNMPAPNSYHSL